MSLIIFSVEAFRGLFSKIIYNKVTRYFICKLKTKLNQAKKGKLIFRSLHYGSKWSKLNKPNVVFQSHYRYLAYINKHKADELLAEITQQASFATTGHRAQNFFTDAPSLNQNELRLRYRAKEAKETERKLSYHKL